MSCNGAHLPQYVFGVFIPLSDARVKQELITKCPSDCYLIEYSNLPFASFYIIKKEKYDSKDELTEDDFMPLN